MYDVEFYWLRNQIALLPALGKISFDETDSNLLDKALREHLPPGLSPVDDGFREALFPGPLHFSYFFRVESGSLSHLPIPELASLAGIACAA